MARDGSEFDINKTTRCKATRRASQHAVFGELEEVLTAMFSNPEAKFLAVEIKPSGYYDIQHSFAIEKITTRGGEEKCLVLHSWHHEWRLYDWLQSGDSISPETRFASDARDSKKSGPIYKKGQSNLNPIDKKGLHKPFNCNSVAAKKVVSFLNAMANVVSLGYAEIKKEQTIAINTLGVDELDIKKKQDGHTMRDTTTMDTSLGKAKNAKNFLKQEYRH